MASYLFYDLETSGLNKAFDQVLQYASKRMSMDLSQTIESHFFESKLTKDVIPSPHALLTHGIGIEEQSHSLDEINVAGLIHRQVNQPNTISLGYNTLGFDDEFLRFTFYRNLLSPYTHQYANQCSRMDIFPMAVFYYLFAPEGIIWPQIDGRVSLKLENLGHENQWLKGKAHHAMNDVDVTIELAQTMMKTNPKAWQYLQGFFNKNIDASRIEQCPEAFADSSGHHFGLMIQASFGSQHAFQAPVISLGRHNHYKNQIVFLRLDKPLDQNDFDDLNASGMIIRKKLGEPGFLLPYDDHYNRHMSNERKAITADNLSKIKLLPEWLDDCSHQAREYTYPSTENLDIDAGLYEFGFLSREEEQLCNQFHIASPHLKASLIDQFKSPHLKQQATRCLWRYHPEELTPQMKQSIATYVDKVIHSQPLFDYRENQKTSISACKQEINSLLSLDQINETQKKLLMQTLDHLNTLQQSLVIA